MRDLENIKEISLIQLLVETLPSKVGSPLSLKNLAGDLQVSQPTIARWVTILDNLYLTFRISPYGAPKIRAVKKEQKIYFWDWTQNEEVGPRFENLVASQLLKFCHYREDTEGYKMELRFLRDTDKREIDFVVLQNKKPIFAVEVKRESVFFQIILNILLKELIFHLFIRFIKELKSMKRSYRTRASFY